MKTILALGALAGLLIFTVRAQGEESGSPPREAPFSPESEVLDWAGFARGFGDGALIARGLAGPPQPDVVDAHWMALTMWGEARSDGEAGMRAVGHVIDNRGKARHRPFVTDTVSEAWQFSCWNSGDPNREAMLNVDTLPREGSDHRLWQVARQVADEILSGRSEDPTGGSLFYHADSVRPAWAFGTRPIRHIGRHLFYRSVSRATERRVDLPLPGTPSWPPGDARPAPAILAASRPRSPEPRLAPHPPAAYALLQGS